MILVPINHYIILQDKVFNTLYLKSSLIAQCKDTDTDTYPHIIHTYIYIYIYIYIYMYIYIYIYIYKLYTKYMHRVYGAWRASLWTL